jgi:uncharacterized protein YegJ (DUF2314 family)
MKIEAKEGFTFKRIHDGFIMGEIIYLGIDYSTGEPREDKAEYYEEVKDESISRHMWLEEVYAKRGAD